MSGSINRKETYKNLKKKGFVDAENNSVDHKYLNFFHNDKFICSTKVSHSGKDITGAMINVMAKQIFLNKSEFVSFAKCTLTKEKYLEKLKLGKHL